MFWDVRNQVRSQALSGPSRG